MKWYATISFVATSLATSSPNLSSLFPKKVASNTKLTALGLDRFKGGS